MRPPIIDDGLFYPLLILVIAMLLVPVAAGALFDLFLRIVGPRGITEVDAITLRTGFSLIAQGVALVGLTVRRVVGRGGLGLSLNSLGLTRSRSGKTWQREVIVGLVAGLVLMALNIIGSWLTQKLFALFMDPDALAEHVSRESGAVAEALGGGASGWIVLLLPVIAVVMAPISEEVFFRGYLYAVLRSRFTRDPWYAVYWSSAVFSIVHFYFVHFIPVFLIGMALAYLYRLRGSLIAPIVAHATTNFIVTVATLAAQAAA